jgi:hypothetical protein
MAPFTQKSHDNLIIDSWELTYNMAPLTQKSHDGLIIDPGGINL